METLTSGRTIESENVESLNVELEGEDEAVLIQFLDFPGKLGLYPPNSVVFKEFYKCKAIVGGKWGNVVDHVGSRSKVTRMESLLESVAREGVELEIVLKELNLNRNKRANSRSEKTARLLKGIYLGIEEGKTELESGRVELEKKVAKLESDLALEGERLAVAKASHKVLISELAEEVQKNVDDVAVQRDRLGHQLIAVEYTKVDLKAIMASTYIEEDEGKKEVPADGGVVTGLDSVSPKTDLDN
ncbi:hypothetical protein GIB67_028235 [Kingdonia uniflora]|uniref:Uncharacterized protein n=1 Tax=Kingdonia uniflora TaxID=39325 RepID=A0A7J7KZF8_9MAGN|nr:hypothetical protein GIB67_028235 [Kingdonia uniflora]